jgi:hypothetical protein
MDADLSPVHLVFKSKYNYKDDAEDLYNSIHNLLVANIKNIGDHVSYNVDLNKYDICHNYGIIIEYVIDRLMQAGWDVVTHLTLNKGMYYIDLIMVSALIKSMIYQDYIRDIVNDRK